MEQLILIFHVLTALAIIGLIMLQQGKGADMGASFGSGSSQTLFGSAGGGNALTKATAFLVVVFFTTSFGLAYVAKNMARAGGLQDIPVVVETPPAVSRGDIPAMEAAATRQSDIPASGLDIPSEGSSEAEVSDIPK